MKNMTNNCNSNVKMVTFEGRGYCVKTSWTTAEDGRTYLAKGVEDGVEPVDGLFPAVELEVFKVDDGSWEVIGIHGPELEDESGGTYGMLLWSDKDGFVER